MQARKYLIPQKRLTAIVRCTILAFTRSGQAFWNPSAQSALKQQIARQIVHVRHGIERRAQSLVGARR
jgi:hypothetical protein